MHKTRFNRTFEQSYEGTLFAQSAYKRQWKTFKDFIHNAVKYLPADLCNFCEQRGFAKRPLQTLYREQIA